MPRKGSGLRIGSHLLNPAPARVAARGFRSGLPDTVPAQAQTPAPTSSSHPGRGARGHEHATPRGFRLRISEKQGAGGAARLRHRTPCGSFSRSHPFVQPRGGGVPLSSTCHLPGRRVASSLAPPCWPYAVNHAQPMRLTPSGHTSLESSNRRQKLSGAWPRLPDSAWATVGWAGLGSAACER